MKDTLVPVVEKFVLRVNISAPRVVKDWLVINVEKKLKCLIEFVHIVEQNSENTSKFNFEVFNEYCAGLKDIEGFSHIILLYHFHLSRGFSLEAKPFLDDEAHGVFAMRGPAWPNSIGISVVRLVSVDGCILYVEDVDLVDVTPLLDIKPYVPNFDTRIAERIGWLYSKSSDADQHRSNGRFSSG